MSFSRRNIFSKLIEIRKIIHNISSKGKVHSKFNLVFFILCTNICHGEIEISCMKIKKVWKLKKMFDDFNTSISSLLNLENYWYEDHT